MTKSILLAEDDKFLRRAAETKLKQAGFDVRVAVDGDEALARAREQPPDLMLLDLLMPKRDGLSVLKALKADTATAAIRVVIISNSSKDLEMQNASTSARWTTGSSRTCRSRNCATACSGCSARRREPAGDDPARRGRPDSPEGRRSDA